MLLSDDELNAMQVEIDDWKARAEAAEAELARVRAGEPFGWYSAKEDDFMLDKIRKTHERLNSHTHRIGKYDTALFTAPQPAAQEPFAWARPDAVDVSQDFRFIKIDDFTVPLYTTPPSAVPVVEQLVEALCELVQSDGLPRTLEQLDASVKKAFAAIAAGQTFIKESKHA